MDSTSLGLQVRSPLSCCFVFFSDRKAPNVIIGGHFEFVTCSPLPTGCLQLIYEYLGLREQALVCLIENFVCGCMPTCMRTYVRMYGPQTAYCFHPLSNTTLLVLHIHVPIQRTVQQSIQRSKCFHMVTQCLFPHG